MAKNLLFITWDGPQTSYMEGLFMPIFNEIAKREAVNFHVIQFTWATPDRIAITQQKANELGIQYKARPIFRKPTAIIGSFYSLYLGIVFLKNYIKKNRIDIVMPRSSMPSIMINRLKKRNFYLLYDADGLALEERVDFSGLLKTSKQYRFFKNEENKILLNSDAVITRSQKAIEIHRHTLNYKNSEKFSVVLNGRNTEFFKPNFSERRLLREEFSISVDATVFVYCGSLGPQYGWDEMMVLFQMYQKKHAHAKFLILTGNIEFAQERLPLHLKTAIILKKVSFEEVPKYLNIADVAFAIRKPTFSMQGVAPIKLGEYLLMGIPTIASAGIGDSEAILKEIPDCFLFHHESVDNIEKALSFIENLKDVNHKKIREYGIQCFSIEKSAQSYLNVLNLLK